ncbi:MAG: acyltransferase family protein [Sphingobacterium composti]|uniref:acyltransferase family protein n=1 Tax=Sphingobacterium composti TaxID=363260 RepID=UPI00135AD9C2|nr:DUF5009 domain-containing protein [Sphingobacterium composti Ten et al. 2007 non Yoo et al. 2007]
MTNQESNRLLSLDVMRGMIMILLAAESTRLYDNIKGFTEEGTFGRILITQFEHHQWHGLYFWDLVQPAFMFMAGAALYISFHYKSKKGITWKANLNHILIRSTKLFFFGVALHCVYSGQLVWELWNVLVQLALTTIIAYLIITKSFQWQIGFTILLLVLTELLYRFTNISGYNEPFVMSKNFGSYMDMVLMGKINNGGWVAVNFIPTAVHTIWGCLAGKLIISGLDKIEVAKRLLIVGLGLLVVGYTLDYTITPIIKRISTTSFAIVSGGYVFLILAGLYWFFDINKRNKYAWIYTVVGMNAIFIYLFFETVGKQWLNKTVYIFVGGLSNLLGVGEQWSMVISSMMTLFVLWSLCYWLYKRKIIFKL